MDSAVRLARPVADSSKSDGTSTVSITCIVDRSASSVVVAPTPTDRLPAPRRPFDVTCPPLDRRLDRSLAERLPEPRFGLDLPFVSRRLVIVAPRFERALRSSLTLLALEFLLL